jgi:glycine oxidase
VNVVVIGAGVIGAACADALALAGHTVHVIDMRGPGRGASHASAGVLAPFIEAKDGDPLLDLCAQSLSMYDAFIEQLRARSHRTIQYARSGTFEIALSVDAAARLKELQVMLAGRGIAADWLEGQDALNFEPAVTTTMLGGLYIKDHGYVAVPDLVGALTHAASLDGVSFESPVEAVRVEGSMTSARVVADGRTIEADAVVIAAGSWSSRVRIANEPPIDVKPIRGQMLHLQWPKDQPMPQRVVWAPRCYAVPWVNGTLLIGATMEDVGFDESSTIRGTYDLMRSAGDALPQVWDASLKEVRVGLRPAPGIGFPLIGPSASSPRVIVATGHFRNGVLLAPITAKKIAEAVAAAADAR